MAEQVRSKWWLGPALTLALVASGGLVSWGIVTTKVNNVQTDLVTAQEKIFILEERQIESRIEFAELKAEVVAQKTHVNDKLAQFEKMLTEIKENLQWLTRRNGRKDRIDDR